MAYCSSCGTEMPDSAHFCSQCGAAIQGKMAAAPMGPPSGDGQAAAGSVSAEPVWTGWPSRKRHLPMLLLGVILLIAPLIAGTALHIPALLYAAIVGALWCTWTIGRMLLEPLRMRYWLTVDRLFLRRGILSRTTDQTELIRVDDLRVTQGLIDQMLGIGNVEVMASSDRTNNDVTLRGVQDPVHVAEVIRENMRNLRQRRGMYIENV